jgi:hypothetical protein
MKKGNQKILTFNYLIVLILSIFSGCIFWANQVYDYDTARMKLPPDIHRSYEQVKNLHFTNLDSLSVFIATHREFRELDEEMFRYKMQKKYRTDFTRAYDGDTAAFSRLLQAMDSDEDWEVIYLFSILCEFDTIQPVQKLKRLIDCSSENRKSNLLEALRIRELESTRKVRRGLTINHYLMPSIIQKERKLSFESTVIDSVLREGINNITHDNTRKKFDVLADILKNGDSLQYYRAREIFISLLSLHDSLSIVSGRSGSSFQYRSSLTYPMPFDTINNIVSVKEVIRAIRSTICSEKKNKINDENDTLCILFDGISLDTEFVDSLCGNQVLVNANEIQRYANRKGRLQCNIVSMRVYEYFATIGTSSREINPIWQEKPSYYSTYKPFKYNGVPHLFVGAGLFHLQKIKGVWIKQGQPLGFIDTN